MYYNMCTPTNVISMSRYSRVCFPLVQAGSEEVRMRASLDEKSQLIETLREQVTVTVCILQVALFPGLYTQLLLLAVRKVTKAGCGGLVFCRCVIQFLVEHSHWQHVTWTSQNYAARCRLDVLILR